MKHWKQYQAALTALLLTVLLVFGGCGQMGQKLTGQPAETVQSVQNAGQPQSAGQDQSTEQMQPSKQGEAGQTQEQRKADGPQTALAEDGSYSSKEEVALYLHLYGHLPDNYITKKEAQSLGWDSSSGNLWDAAPGKSIGGDRFGNYEGLLPKKDGRQYYECDIEYEGGYRSGKRIVYSNDGLIYYTEDHYQSFEYLYGEES